MVYHARHYALKWGSYLVLHRSTCRKQHRGTWQKWLFFSSIAGQKHDIMFLYVQVKEIMSKTADASLLWLHKLMLTTKPMAENVTCPHMRFGRYLITLSTVANGNGLQI